ncbi:DUF1751 domain-containing protein [Dactylosporangium roseum]|uniref:DUF1751 domain-containing protein n=1 Tax=Dactylosporangium roseum TaxID=47989 RepID=A0ABY5YUV1_9ACTN|nr:rhomboid family protein [Dactylosporangium roseum]UWZ33506.1 DUF1751 domain-containing protein [Dactylosporangium roseum]
MRVPLRGAGPAPEPGRAGSAPGSPSSGPIPATATGVAGLVGAADIPLRETVLPGWTGHDTGPAAPAHRLAGVTGFKWLYEDPPGLVPAWYLPGGDLAEALAAAAGPAAKTKVLLRAATRLRLAPLYVLAVAVAGILLARAGPRTRDHLIAANSTNVANLDQHRVWTLVTSAFVVTEPLGALTAVHLLMLTGAAELLWGRRRLVEVFLLTHVVTSCLVYALLRTGIRYEWVERATATASDVGTSYGAHAVGGALAFSLPVRARRVLVPLALAAVLLPLVGERTFTDVGHLLSTLIGLLAGWQMRRRPLAGRPRRPARMRDDRPMAFAFGAQEQARTGAGPERRPGRPGAADRRPHRRRRRAGRIVGPPPHGTAERG